MRQPGETDAEMRARVKGATPSPGRLLACPFGHCNESVTAPDITVPCYGVAHSYCGQPTYEAPAEVQAAWRLNGSEWEATDLLGGMIDRGEYKSPIEAVPWDQVPR